MDKEMAKIFLGLKVAECIDDFPYDFPMSEEAEVELGMRVVTCLEKIQSPEDLWAILQADDTNFELALNCSTPLYGAYGGDKVSSVRAEAGVKFCILHNILFFKCLELLPEKKRQEHGIIS